MSSSDSLFNRPPPSPSYHSSLPPPPSDTDSEVKTDEAEFKRSRPKTPPPPPPRPPGSPMAATSITQGVARQIQEGQEGEMKSKEVSLPHSTPSLLTTGAKVATEVTNKIEGDSKREGEPAPITIHHFSLWQKFIIFIGYSSTEKEIAKDEKISRLKALSTATDKIIKLAETSGTLGGALTEEDLKALATFGKQIQTDFQTLQAYSDVALSNLMKNIRSNKSTVIRSPRMTPTYKRLISDTNLKLNFVLERIRANGAGESKDFDSIGRPKETPLEQLQSNLESIREQLNRELTAQNPTLTRHKVLAEQTYSHATAALKAKSQNAIAKTAYHMEKAQQNFHLLEAHHIHLKLQREATLKEKLEYEATIKAGKNRPDKKLQDLDKKFQIIDKNFQIADKDFQLLKKTLISDFDSEGSLKPARLIRLMRNPFGLNREQKSLFNAIQQKSTQEDMENFSFGQLALLKDGLTLAAVSEIDTNRAFAAWGKVSELEDRLMLGVDLPKNVRKEQNLSDFYHKKYEQIAEASYHVSRATKLIDRFNTDPKPLSAARLISSRQVLLRQKKALGQYLGLIDSYLKSRGNAVPPDFDAHRWTLHRIAFKRVKIALDKIEKLAIANGGLEKELEIEGELPNLKQIKSASPLNSKTIAQYQTIIHKLAGQISLNEQGAREKLTSFMDKLSTNPALLEKIKASPITNSLIQRHIKKENFPQKPLNPAEKLLFGEALLSNDSKEDYAQIENLEDLIIDRARREDFVDIEKLIVAHRKSREGEIQESPLLKRLRENPDVHRILNRAIDHIDRLASSNDLKDIEDTFHQIIKAAEELAPSEGHQSTEKYERHLYDARRILRGLNLRSQSQEITQQKRDEIKALYIELQDVYNNLGKESKELKASAAARPVTPPPVNINSLINHAEQEIKNLKNAAQAFGATKNEEARETLKEDAEEASSQISQKIAELKRELTKSNESKLQTYIRRLENDYQIAAKIHNTAVDNLNPLDVKEREALTKLEKAKTEGDYARLTEADLTLLHTATGKLGNRVLNYISDESRATGGFKVNTTLQKLKIATEIQTVPPKLQSDINYLLNEWSHYQKGLPLATLTLEENSAHNQLEQAIQNASFWGSPTKNISKEPADIAIYQQLLNKLANNAIIEDSYPNKAIELAHFLQIHHPEVLTALIKDPLTYSLLSQINRDAPNSLSIFFQLPAVIKNHKPGKISIAHEVLLKNLYELENKAKRTPQDLPLQDQYKIAAKYYHEARLKSGLGELTSDQKTLFNQLKNLQTPKSNQKDIPTTDLIDLLTAQVLAPVSAQQRNIALIQLETINELRTTSSMPSHSETVTVPMRKIVEATDLKLVQELSNEGHEQNSPFTSLLNIYEFSPELVSRAEKTLANSLKELEESELEILNLYRELHTLSKASETPDLNKLVLLKEKIDRAERKEFRPQIDFLSQQLRDLTRAKGYFELSGKEKILLKQINSAPSDKEAISTKEASKLLLKMQLRLMGDITLTPPEKISLLTDITQVHRKLKIPLQENFNHFLRTSSGAKDVMIAASIEIKLRHIAPSVEIHANFIRQGNKPLNKEEQALANKNLKTIEALREELDLHSEYYEHMEARLDAFKQAITPPNKTSSIPATPRVSEKMEELESKGKYEDESFRALPIEVQETTPFSLKEKERYSEDTDKMDTKEEKASSSLPPVADRADEERQTRKNLTNALSEQQYFGSSDLPKSPKDIKAYQQLLIKLATKESIRPNPATQFASFLQMHHPKVLSEILKDQPTRTALIEAIEEVDHSSHNIQMPASSLSVFIKLQIVMQEPRSNKISDKHNSLVIELAKLERMAIKQPENKNLQLQYQSARKQYYESGLAKFTKAQVELLNQFSGQDQSIDINSLNREAVVELHGILQAHLLAPATIQDRAASLVHLKRLVKNFPELNDAIIRRTEENPTIKDLLDEINESTETQVINIKKDDKERFKKHLKEFIGLYMFKPDRISIEGEQIEKEMDEAKKQLERIKNYPSQGLKHQEVVASLPDIREGFTKDRIHLHKEMHRLTTDPHPTSKELSNLKKEINAFKAQMTKEDHAELDPEMNFLTQQVNDLMNIHGYGSENLTSASEEKEKASFFE